MIYEKIAEIDSSLSRLVYGTPHAASAGEYDKAAEIYDMAYEMGFRVFDTAYSYGQGETSLGKWLVKSDHRDDVVILDKGCNPSATYTKADVFSADTIRTQVNESLDRLQTDHVELYILHRDDPNLPVDEIVEVLNELKTEGKICRFGGSNWTLKRTIEANKYASEHGLTPFTVCSPNFTYARLVRDPWGGSVTITGDDNADFRKWLADIQMPVFAYSALARGFLSGKYKSNSPGPVEEYLSQAPIMEYYAPENIERLKRAEQLAAQLGVTVPQIIIGWHMKQDMLVFPIVSPSSEAHMRDVVEGINVNLTEDQLAFLNSPV